MNWTDERVELLRKLWADGLSASQIAAQMGGVSRNAVIGKVHRLKLSGRGKQTSSQPRVKKPAATGGGSRVSTTPRQPSSGPRVKLVELSERTCKWPIGDPLAQDFAFCGHESGESGPYCQFHAKLAYQPASDRRRVR